MTSRSIAALIPAAGVGSRMQAALPKQYLEVAPGKTMLAAAAERLAKVVGADHVFVGASPEDAWIDDVDLGGASVMRTGGATRAATVTNTLAALLKEGKIAPHDLVLVHDAARPLVDPKEVRALADAVCAHLAAGTADGAVLAVAVTDTVKRADAQGFLVEDVDRTGLWRIATPQCFEAQALLDALQAHPDVTDESSAVRLAGGRVAVIACSPDNIKVTTPSDLEFARRQLRDSCTASQGNAGTRPAFSLRVGLGYDSHRLEAGRKFILGGVEIPHEKGLAGHSDADALLHAVTDAILGAAGKGNIGILFPDTDPAFKGADSRTLLKEAWRVVSREGWRVANLDCVIVAQKPKLNPHVPAMAACIAGILGIAPEAVNIKPKTNEGMGFEGRQEGVSTQAVVLLTKP